MKRLPLTLCLCMFCIGILLTSCAAESLEKIQDNLGFLEAEDGELVLLLNTEIDLTTVRASTHDVMVEEAQEQLRSFHKLIDSHHAYTDADGQTVINMKYLNDHFGEGPVEVDDVLLGCLEEAIDMAELTQGYFNPTVGLLADVYEGRFEHVGKVQESPTPAAIEAARATVVPYAQLRDHIVIDWNAHTVDLRPYKGQAFRVSLGGIGKGYALSQLGFSHDTSYLVSAGASSMRAHVAPDEEGVSWTIGSHVPDSTDILFAFRLDDGSVSTSGDDENYYLLEDGTRVHHILNPFTGASENYWRNVVLVGDDAGVLDALSTALFNLEDEQVIKELISAVEQSYDMTIDYCFVAEEEAGTFELRGSQGFFDRLLPEYVSDKLNPRMYIMDEEGE